jgi:transposase InsO family protein
MCYVLEVSRSGYYAWRHRAPSATAARRVSLTEQIRVVHEGSRQVYGAPRIHRELLASDVRCSRGTVAKLMRRAGIRSKMRRRFVVRTTDSRHGHKVAPNRLNRRFRQARPDQAWAADITYIATGEGWLYLAAVIDLCSRKIVGWATGDSLAAELCCRALQMALVHRRPGRTVLHHSDRGVQYACDEYQGLLAEHGLTASMSRTGNCYDNAVMESFFGKLKTELVHHETYATREAARQSLFEYIEVFYNRRRRHSSLGYLSPAEHEQRLAHEKISKSPDSAGEIFSEDNPSSASAAARDPRKGSHGRLSRNSTRTKCLPKPSVNP